MIRISVTHEEDTVCFKVEGRLAGYGVDELRGAILRHEPQCNFEVDIADVTFLDEDGEKLLLWIHRVGGKFQSKGVFSNYLLERIGISAVQEETDCHHLAARMHSGAMIESASDHAAAG